VTQDVYIHFYTYMYICVHICTHCESPARCVYAQRYISHVVGDLHRRCVYRHLDVYVYIDILKVAQTKMMKQDVYILFTCSHKYTYTYTCIHLHMFTYVVHMFTSQQIFTPIYISLHL